MQQEGLVGDESVVVALSGRVYCYADASSGPIRPGDLLTTSGKPGQFVTHLRLIPPNVGSQLAALSTDAEEFVLGVHITIKGTTLGGVDIESNEFIYPIEFCWGCLTATCPDGTYPSCLPGQDANALPCGDDTKPSLTRSVYSAT